MQRFELHQFTDDGTLAKHVAGLWVGDIAAAARRGGRFLVALSGGRIAAKFFQAAADTARQQRAGFGHVHFFWADERCVPPGHADSNFAPANRLIFQPFAVPPAQIHRLRGEDDEAMATSGAGADLRGIAPADESGQPVLDLVLLGMGEDGHVASLFPNEPEAVAGSADLYRAVQAVKPPPRRITMGYRVIAAARAVWVLAAGAGKAAALKDSLRPGGATPLARVLEMRSHTVIFSDCAGE